MYSQSQYIYPHSCCSYNLSYDIESVSSMNVKYSDDSHLIQAQKQITYQEKKMIQELLYYMEAAYKRVIAAVDEMNQSLNMNDDFAKTALLKLNFLIDNTNIQFKMAHKKFPPNHREIMEESLRNLNQHFKNFLDSQNSQVSFEGVNQEHLEQLKESFSKFQKVLDLEPVSLTPVSRNEADGNPSTLVEAVETYYAQLNQSENELAEIKKTDDVAPLMLDRSTWNFWEELY